MPIFLQLLQSIPNVVWSGLLASLFTLAGVLISNWSNTNRLKIQLNHDAEQKAMERIIGLRREVYLRVVEELVKANTHLASLPQLDFMKVNPATGFQGFLSSAAKLQLVAEPKTALLVNDLVVDFGEIIVKSIANSAPVQNHRFNIASANDLYERAVTEVRQILSKMAELTESGQSNEAAYRALQNSFELQQSLADKYLTERSSHQREFQRESQVFSRDVMIELRKIGRRQIPALIAIRQDLGLTTEIEEFHAQMERNWDRMSKALDAALDKISS